MFGEYDVVEALSTVNSKVQKGTKGTILIIYKSVPPKYEVEFVDEKGNTLDVLTVNEKDINYAVENKNKH